MGDNRITSFKTDNHSDTVIYMETMQVKEGVSCDVYNFKDDKSKDLAIVTVDKGFKTPLQRILKGDTTTEGFVSGKGVLSVTSASGELRTYEFDDSKQSQPILVHVGELMQWYADGDSDLVFYEVCSPPYEDGRFENLPDSSSSPNT